MIRIPMALGQAESLKDKGNTDERNESIAISMAQSRAVSS